MGDPSVTLPPSVENLIMKICNDKRIDPPNSWARRRLATVDEGVATEILAKIYNQQTQIRDLSRLIVWFIDNPHSPVRTSAQRSSVVHPQSPCSNQVRSPQSPVGYSHQSPPNSPFPNNQSLVRHPHRSTSDNQVQGLAVHPHQNPQSPVQSPFNSPFQNDQSLVRHPLCSTSNTQVQGHSVHPHQNPPYCEAQIRQSLIGHHHQNPSYSSFQDAQNFNEHSHQNLLNNRVQGLVMHPHPTPSSVPSHCTHSNPSPCGRGSPSFCDLVHAAAASFPSEDSEDSSFHLCKNSTASLLPCSQTASSSRTNRRLNFSVEPQIKEGLGSISYQLTVLGQLEYRRLFLLLSYIGRRKLEEVISPDAADDIVRRKDISMNAFELHIWNTYGRHFCEKPEVRREYADWESGRTCFYYCYVYGDGSYSFQGPCLNTTKTHLQRELGDENVLIAKFLGEGKHSVTKIANEGILVGSRHYRFFVFKDESNDVKKKDKMEKDKSSTFTGVKCYFVRYDSLAPCNGGESYILSSRSIYEARCLFMHVHMVSSMAKYMARFSLILSKTIKLPVDLSTVEVVQIEDICCRDENGCIICGEDGEQLILTDGTGFISEDLALQCPEDFGRARFVRERDFQRFRDYIVSENVRDPEATSKEPPLLMQCRLFKDGYAVKGTLLVNRKLPPRTIQIRTSMVKVDRDEMCPVTETFNSLEIVAASHKPKRTFLSRSLTSLLNYGGVPRSFFLDVLLSALAETQMAYTNIRAALRVASINGEVDDDSTALRMISAGVPLTEPHLQDRLSKLVNLERTKLKQGKLPISESFYLIGTADPTGILDSNEVCVILDNGQISGKVLVYRNPGLHFGDIHILEAVYVKELEEIIGNAKYGIFFSTKGQRSAAAEIANGDFDGDVYWISRNPQLLKHFRASEPWNRVYSTPLAVNRKPTEFSPEELEDELVRLFLQTRECSNPMGVAANSWLVFMDRLLTLGDGSSNEKNMLKNKMLKLIDIYYDAVDAPKSGKKINVPPDLIPDKYPHFMQRDGSCSYHSTSILGEIYDKLDEFQSNVRTVGEVWKLPAFEVAVPERYLNKWKELYNQYRHDMTEALKRSQDLKNSAADEVIKKYKQLLYEAEDFQESRKDIEELYNEALAIYHVSYNLAISKGEVRKCGFAWKVAGAALCNLHASTRKENPIRILPSLLRDVVT